MQKIKILICVLLAAHFSWTLKFFSYSWISIFLDKDNIFIPFSWAFKVTWYLNTRTYYVCMHRYMCIHIYVDTQIFAHMRVSSKIHETCIMKKKSILGFQKYLHTNKLLIPRCVSLLIDSRIWTVAEDLFIIFFLCRGFKY